MMELPSYQTARKQHRCTECGKSIGVGHRYVKIFSITDKDTAKYHIKCKAREVRDNWVDESVYNRCNFDGAEARLINGGL